MTKDEFLTKYRSRLLLFVTEAWAVRREQPSVLGMVIDKHHHDLTLLLSEIWKDMHQPNNDNPPNVQTAPRGTPANMPTRPRAN